MEKFTKYQKNNYKQLVDKVNGTKVYAIWHMGYKQGHIIIEKNGTKYPRLKGHWYTSLQAKNAYNDYLTDDNI